MNAFKSAARRFALFVLSKSCPESRDALGVMISAAGNSVTPESAMKTRAVFSCVKLISESIASLPMSIYEKTDSGKRKAIERSEYRVFHDVANPEADAFQFWQAIYANMLIFGTGYAEVVRNGAGEIVEMWNITTPFVRKARNRATGELQYEVYCQSDNEIHILRKDQIFHVDWFSFDALNVKEPIKIAQNIISISLAAEQYAGNYFKNGANVGGIVTYPEEMSDDEYERFKSDIRSNYSGLSKSARLMFLEQGATFQKVSNTPEESQMIDTRKFQVIEAAAIYNVPPHMIGDLDHATFSNIEQMSLNFVIYTLRPYFVRVEKAIIAQLYTKEESKRFFPKINADALLRGDYKSRMEGYALGRQNGWMSANDIRDKEDDDLLPEEDGGNAYLVNGNMISIKKAMEGGEKNG